MPQYAVLIYERVAAEDLPQEVMDAHMGVPQRIAEAGGKEIGGIALQPNDTATTIRDGLVTDGPFIETKESMAGMCVVEARDLNEAMQIAGRMPLATMGSIEVRPLVPSALPAAT